MPFTNSDKITTNELAEEVASRIGIPITRAEWEALIESGDITDQTTTMYYIIDDGAQSTTEEIAEEVALVLQKCMEKGAKPFCTRLQLSTDIARLDDGSLPDYWIH